MPRGIPNKKDKILNDIDKEMNVATLEPPKVGEVVISKEPPIATQGANEFGSDYTIEVISDNEPGADIFRIPHKDPHFSYRFLRDDKANLSIKSSNNLMFKGGWQIVPIRHLTEVNKIDKKHLQPDGSYKVGEMVLAFMPMKYFLMKQAEDKRKADEAMAGVQRLVDGESRVKMKGVHGISKGSIKEGPLNYGTHNEVEEN